MLQSLIGRVQRGVDTIVGKYVGRAAVAVPFVIAAGFGTAALAVKLSQDYGAVTAYASIAALFALAGLVTAIVVSANGRNGHGSEVALAATSATRLADGKGDQADLLDRETVMALLTSAAPLAIPVVLRALTGRRGVFVLLVAVVAYFFLKSPARWDDRAATDPASPVSS